jgi:hypothetical protein
MNRWTWPDTVLVLAAIVLTLALAASLRVDGAATCQAAVRTVPLDTVGCGRLETCTPTVRARWMSHNPFAAPSRTETR